MEYRRMKRFPKVFIIIVLIFSLFEENMTSYADNKTANSIYGDNLLEYIQGYNDNLLLNRKNYGYMNLVEDFQSDWISLYFLEMTDFFIKTGAEPDKRKYMDVLLNIIATYDFDNASAISEQNNLDNMKEFKDYALDFTNMGKETISIIIGNNSTASQLESSIATAIDGLAVLVENIDNWIDAFSNLETIIQDYEKYDDFLKLIEENGNGELKEAAATLRKGMSEAIEIKLDTYVEISNENFEKYSEFFFTDAFFTIIKQTPQYNSDESVKFFVDCGDNIVSKYSTLKSSWELGKLIGKLVGNIAVGGEDKIDRLLEMMALHDVSVILQEKIIKLSNDFVENYGTEDEEKEINEYVLYSQYLIGCRIRGEYCIYSTVANDGGLLAWFNKKSAEEAKIWYEGKTQKILNIQSVLLRIYDVQEINNNLKMEVGRDLNKFLSTIYQNGIREYDFENYDIGSLMEFAYNIPVEGISYDDGEGHYYYKASYDNVNDILNSYFGITTPKEQIGDILFKDEEYHFPVLDYGELGMPIVIANNIEPEDNEYRVTFDLAYIWPENFDTGELNPIEDWNIYYDYGIDQIKDDIFCEMLGTGYAVLEQKGENLIVTEFYSDVERIAENSESIMPLTEEEAYMILEEYWTSLGNEMPDVDYEGLTEYGYCYRGFDVPDNGGLGVTYFRICVDVDTGLLYDDENDMYLQ